MIAVMVLVVVLVVVVMVILAERILLSISKTQMVLLKLRHERQEALDLV
ncbi:MAG: hypothetical protein M3162_08515 [Thermoproteota archaeon]|nr:hypothetical protein [Thermoproteota archaeon]